MSIPIDKLLKIAKSNYSDELGNSSIKNDCRKLLFGSEEPLLLGTYDHLRSPFSNRLLVSDKRLVLVANELGIDAVSIILDCVTSLKSTPRGSHRGDQIGLSVFSKNIANLDSFIELKSHNDNYSSRFTVHINESDLFKYLYDPIISYMREKKGTSKEIAITTAEKLVMKAKQLVDIYKVGMEKHNSPRFDHRFALLNIQSRLKNELGLFETEHSPRKVLLSSLLANIADVLLLLKSERWFTTFLDNCYQEKIKLLKPSIIDGKSDHGCSVESYEFLKGSIDCLLDSLRMGKLCPTTALLFVLFHYVAGYHNFGNSNGYINHISRLLGVKAMDRIDILPCNENSIPITSIVFPLGVTLKPQKNLTIDYLWFTKQQYVKMVDSIVAGEASTYQFEFGQTYPLYR